MVENSEQADERDKETVKVQGPGILPGKWIQCWGWTCPMLSPSCRCRPQSSRTPVSEGQSLPRVEYPVSPSFCSHTYLTSLRTEDVVMPASALFCPLV